jgi:hypothetical protein
MAEKEAGSNEVQFESIAHRAPTMITSFLKGIKFPATVDDLLAQAKHNGAPDAVLNNIGKLPKGNYLQMIDVTHNFGRIRPTAS